jgi:hypothetical protein
MNPKVVGSGTSENRGTCDLLDNSSKLEDVSTVAHHYGFKYILFDLMRSHQYTNSLGDKGMSNQVSPRVRAVTARWITVNLPR